MKSGLRHSTKSCIDHALWESNHQKGIFKYKVKTHKQRLKGFNRLNDTQMTTLGKENLAEKTIAKDLDDLVVTSEDRAIITF